MIELLSLTRCTGCNACVHACPTNVFDEDPAGPPRIARKDDCQTCFMCELYCPEDALFVAAEADAAAVVDEAGLAAAGLLGSYRAAVGWGRGRSPTTVLDYSQQLLQRAHS